MPSPTQKPSDTQPESRSALARAVTAAVGPLNRGNVMAWIKVIVAVLVIEWLFFQTFVVPSSSMAPTLRGDPRYFWGDRVAVNKLVYGPRIPFTDKRLFKLGEPKRWDIVVFRAVPKNAPHKILIKRIVGLPGERIQIRGGKVFVNGAPLELPPNMPDVYYTMGPSDALISGLAPQLSPKEFDAVLRDQVGPFVYGVLSDDQYSIVPENHYLVLGDNSPVSGDGRIFGWVPNGNILGRASCIWWPLTHRRDLTGFSKTWQGIGLLYCIPLLAILYILCSWFLVQTWRVGAQTVPDPLEKGDHVLVNVLAFGVRVPFSRRRLLKRRPPQRGDIVLCRSEGAADSDQDLLVARVVGHPGDTAEFPSGDLVGIVRAIWWPPRRWRRFHAGAPTQQGDFPP